jgi:hypothetical protein
VKLPLPPPIPSERPHLVSFHSVTCVALNDYIYHYGTHNYDNDSLHVRIFDTRDKKWLPIKLPIFLPHDQQDKIEKVSPYRISSPYLLFPWYPSSSLSSSSLSLSSPISSSLIQRRGLIVHVTKASGRSGTWAFNVYDPNTNITIPLLQDQMTMMTSLPPPCYVSDTNKESSSIQLVKRFIIILLILKQLIIQMKMDPRNVKIQTTTTMQKKIMMMIHQLSQ